MSLSGTTVTFTPNPNYNGPASFTYTICETATPTNCDTATASFTVTAVNDAPVAVADTLAAIAEDSGPHTISVATLTGNDTDVDNATSELTIGTVTSGTGGTVVKNANGTVTFTPALNFVGNATFTYTVCDPGGLCSSAATVTIPVTAVVDPPVVDIDDSLPTITKDNTPTISGTTDMPAGSTVTITRDGGTAVCTATVQAGGTWSCDAPALSDGPHVFTATVTDASGDSATDTYTLTIDTTAPVIDITDSLPTLTNDNTPTISGTTDMPAGSTVTVTEGGNPVCTATVQAGGSWSCVSPMVSDGPHTFTATVTDAAGNSASDTYTVTVDATAPVIDITDTLPTLTKDNTPAISGTTDMPVGSTVTVTQGGNPVCTATVGAGGVWSCDSPQLHDGRGGH